MIGDGLSNMEVTSVSSLIRKKERGRERESHTPIYSACEINIWRDREIERMRKRKRKRDRERDRENEIERESER